MEADPYRLDLLRDITEPERVSWWPPAPFWWCLIALLAIWLVYWIGMSTHRWFRNAYRRQALRELESIVARDPSWPTNLSALLKRVALVSFPRDQVASLSGQGWLLFLDQTCDKVNFREGPSRILGSASFDPDTERSSDADVAAVVSDVRKWILGHRVETAS